MKRQRAGSLIDMRRRASPRGGRRRYGVASQCQRGFTLLELIIGMTLVALISVLLYSGLRLVGRSWDAEARYAERTADGFLVQDFLRRQLQQTRELFQNDPEQGRVIAFAGSAKVVEFAGPMLSYQAVGGLYFQRLEFVEGEAGEELRMTWRPYRVRLDDPDLTDAVAESAEPAVLLTGLQGGEFTYFGSVTDADEPEWLEEWTDRSRLPRLVRIHIDVGEDDWPELVVALP